MIFFRLGMNPLVPYDEAIYSEVAKEMVLRGNWITQYYNQEPWFEKPPMQTWVTASFFSLFRINEFWSRAASALSGLLLILVTYFIGSQFIGRRVGVLSGVILLSSLQYLWTARQGQMDMMLTLFIYLAVAAFLYTKREEKSWYFFWAAFSLAFMVKFWAAGVVLIAVAIMLLMEKQLRRAFSSRHFWRGVLLSVVLILPWHLAMLYLHGSDFIDRYLFFDLIQRTTTGLEQNVGTASYYYDQLLRRLYPWHLLIPFALTINLYEWKKVVPNREPLILYILIAVVFVIYSFVVQTKLPWYITPIYPAISLSIGLLIVRAFDSRQTPAFWAFSYTALIVLLKSTARVTLLWLIFSAVFLLGLLLVIYVLRKQSSFVLKHVDQNANKAIYFASKLLHILLAVPVKEWVYKFAMVAMLLLFVGTGLRQSIHLYIDQPSPSAIISKMAGEKNPGEFIITTCFYDNNAPCIYDPEVMFYSNRPCRSAMSEQQLFSFTDYGKQDIIISSDLFEQINSEYNIEVFEVVPPFVYGAIERK
jgi:4-amino-4-deoxy-L-arabinose transferase-like glycosyltransferase